MAMTAGKTIFVYITVPSRNEARRIARRLLQKRLIACANMHKIESMYLWKGKLVDGPEWVLLCKSVGPNFGKVKSEVEKVHSYTIPCIIKISAVANKKYFDWVVEETKRRK